jgi:hypothetical protein
LRSISQLHETWCKFRSIHQLAPKHCHRKELTLYRPSYRWTILPIGSLCFGHGDLSDRNFFCLRLLSWIPFLIFLIQIEKRHNLSKQMKWNRISSSRLGEV